MPSNTTMRRLTEFLGLKRSVVYLFGLTVLMITGEKLLYFSTSFGALVIAFIVRGLKEFGEPTRKAIILDLSPAEAKARGYGLYYFVRDFIVSFAAFLGGWIRKQSPSFNFFTAAAFGVVGTLLFMLYGKGTRTDK